MAAPLSEPFLVVVGDDVLTELGSDRLEPVPEVSDHGEVAQDRVFALGQVASGGEHHQCDDHDHNGEPPFHGPGP